MEKVCTCIKMVINSKEITLKMKKEVKESTPLTKVENYNLILILILRNIQL